MAEERQSGFCLTLLSSAYDQLHEQTEGGRLSLVELPDDRLCLAVLADATSDIGLIAYEMAMLVKRVGQNLSSPLRPASSFLRSQGQRPWPD